MKISTTMINIFMIERWLGKFGQPVKWISCLTAAMMPQTRRDHDKANPPDA
jgi:hypothetical protein